MFYESLIFESAIINMYYFKMACFKNSRREIETLYLIYKIILLYFI